MTIRTGALLLAVVACSVNAAAAKAQSVTPQLETDGPKPTVESPRTPATKSNAVDPITDETAAAVSDATAPLIESFEDTGFQPRWSARVGTIFLQRSRPDSTPFIINGNTGAQLLNPSGFDFPFTAGVDAGLIRYGDWADFDFRYFGANQSSASQGPINAGPGAQLAIPGTGAPATDPTNLMGSAVSSLNSVEANLRRNVSQTWTLLGGFRYVSFRDAMSVNAFDPISLSRSMVGLGTTNNLFGVQVGGSAILWTRNRFRIESAFKTGIYANGASNSLSIASAGGTFTDRGQHDHTACVTDLNFVGVYQITDRWAARAGYQLLWLSGVATAADQLHNINFSTNTFTMNTSHTVFYEGAMVSLERTW